MKIQTFSIVVGTSACDGNCPFCISHMTGYQNLDPTPDINYRNFQKSCSLATLGGCTTVLFTGKGEPLLYPADLTKYLLKLQEMGDPFPFLELQTNGLQIGWSADYKSDDLRINLMNWRNYGLNTIALSVVGINPDDNKRIYHPDYPDLSKTVDYIHSLGYSVRLCVMMHKGMVDCAEKIYEVADWCKKHGVAQSTFRPIRKCDSNTVQSTPEQRYVDENTIPVDYLSMTQDIIDRESTHLMTLMHGAHTAKVYDHDGQNICMSDCLTTEPQSDDIRTLIFYNSGELMYSWQHPGARLL